MKKLRLLFTELCNRNCKGCCNKDWDLYLLPKVTHWNYDEILITGGEPFLFGERLIFFLKALRIATNAKIYIYTAKVDEAHIVAEALKYCDGITLTLHKESDSFHYDVLRSYFLQRNVELSNKSLRLNVFKGINYTKDTNWKIRDNIVWKKDCPLPKNEEFKRL